MIHGGKSVAPGVGDRGSNLRSSHTNDFRNDSKRLPTWHSGLWGYLCEYYITGTCSSKNRYYPIYA